MIKLRTIALLLLSLLSFPSLAGVDLYFEQLKSKPEALYQFLYDMPKGGELHYHLAGGAYPQVMLQLAKNSHVFCLDLKENSVYKKNVPCEVSTQALSRKKLYLRLLKTWSMIGYKPETPQSNHDHFFASFLKFMPIVAEYRAQLLIDVIERAAKQHVQYMEIMVLTDDAASTQFAPKKLNLKKLDKQRQKLLANPDFQKNVALTVNKANDILFNTHRMLSCSKNPAQPPCQVMVRFQYYVLREQPIEKVFAQAVNGFEAANRKGLFVAVNLVQPEDGAVSMRDYKQQMAIFSYLHQVYPNVHISLHAGELTDDLVNQSGLTSHIHDAIHIGQAERIGHGVDILSERNAMDTLKNMRNRDIAVEINLTSNETLLGISEQSHPLTEYLKQGVPVVLSTDDEGILQTNLTRQYWIAATKYNLNYKTIKKINRNALTYSFLSGKSIWQNGSVSKLIPICRDLNSMACQLYVSQNPKAAQQRLLELALYKFEQKYVEK